MNARNNLCEMIITDGTVNYFMCHSPFFVLDSDSPAMP